MQDFTPQERETHKKLSGFLEELKSNHADVNCYVRYDKIVCGTDLFKLNDIGDNIIPVN